MLDVRKTLFACLLVALVALAVGGYFLRQRAAGGASVEPTAEAVPQPPVEAPVNPLITVDVEEIAAGYAERGTAFPLSRDLWVTARHIAGDGCGRIVLIVNGTKIPAEVKFLEPNADLAVLQTSTEVGSGLPIERRSVTADQSAFAFGFPHGSLGGTQDELIGQTHLKLRGHLSGVAPVLAWVEIERYPSDSSSIGGISGGPMLDDQGNVVGVIVAASVRRGRNYSVTPDTLLAVQAQFELGQTQSPARSALAQPVSLEASASALSKDARIAETYCFPP